MRSKKRTLISNCDFKFVIFVGGRPLLLSKINSYYATGSNYNHDLENIYRSWEFSANDAVLSFIFIDVSEELAAIVIKRAQEDSFYVWHKTCIFINILVRLSNVADFEVLLLGFSWKCKMT